MGELYRSPKTFGHHCTSYSDVEGTALTGWSGTLLDIPVHGPEAVYQYIQRCDFINKK